MRIFIYLLLKRFFPPPYADRTAKTLRNAANTAEKFGNVFAESVSCLRQGPVSAVPKQPLPPKRQTILPETGAMDERSFRSEFCCAAEAANSKPLADPEIGRDSNPRNQNTHTSVPRQMQSGIRFGIPRAPQRRHNRTQERHLQDDYNTDLLRLQGKFKKICLPHVKTARAKARAAENQFL